MIFTTDEHQFWSITDRSWVPAIEVDEGEQLRQADSFDDEILRQTPITQAPGSLLYRLEGTLRGNSGMYEIGVNTRTNTIFHRTFRSN